jgi:hypothetical protein
MDMMRYIFLSLSFFVTIFVNAMQMDVIVKNCTSKPAKICDFSFTNSSLIRSVPNINKVKEVKIAPNGTFELTIVPIAGKKPDFFIVNVGGKENIKIWWNFVPSKGYGPFLEQDTEKYRAIKKVKEIDSITFFIVKKTSLQFSESLVRDLAQYLDIQDISDQTGFTQGELQNRQHAKKSGQSVGTK